MSSEIIVALISLLGTLGGSLGGILVSSKMTNYRLQQLENKVAMCNAYKSDLVVDIHLTQGDMVIYYNYTG